MIDVKARGPITGRSLLHSILLLVALTISCSGGSDDGAGGGAGVINDGGGSTSLVGSFESDTPNPGNESVTLTGTTGSGGSGYLVTLHVNVTETQDVFGAAFDLEYDPSKAEYRTWSPGSALESDGNQVSYLVNASQPGRIVVSATRPAGGTGVSVSGTRQLINVTLAMIEAGASTVDFDVNAALLDDQANPQPIQNIAFSGGNLTAN